nr:reverse transcriptase domain-containing protein [Tanacetum cinerariifolium]
MSTKEHDKRHRSRRSRSPRTSVFSSIRRERLRSPIRRQRSRSPRQRAKEGGVFKRLGSRGKSVSARSDSYNRHSHSRYMEALSESEDNGAPSAGKSPSGLRDLLARSMLNVESGAEVATTVPFVTSSVSATPEHDSGVPTAPEDMDLFAFIYIPNPAKVRVVERERAEALREYCDKNYDQLLPIIAEKFHKEKERNEKLKEVKARLNFKGCYETSRYSELRTMSTKEHEKGHRSRGKSVSACSDSHNQHSHLRYTKALSESKDSGCGHWKSRSKRKKSSGRGGRLSFSPNPEIFFPPLGEDEGTKGPMIIEAEIGGYCVHRILDEFHGREITVFVQWNYWKTMSQKVTSSLSTAHGMLKIPVEGGVITLKHSKLVPLECAMVSGPGETSSAAKPIIEERVKVEINPEYPEQTVVIGSTLTEGGRNKLCGLLQRKLDIFAWKPADMTGVPRHIAEHRLNVREGSTSGDPYANDTNGKKELIVYLAAAKETVSAVLMTEREAKQMPIYFVSRALRGPELNYTSMEKLVLAIVHASKRLKRKLQAVSSTAHGMLKIPVEGGVITLKHSKLVPLECAMVSGPGETSSAAKPIIEERVKVEINPEYPEQTVVIGSTLTEGGCNKLCGLLQRKLDIFAWKPADMTGVPRHIAEHRLNVREGCSPVRQKKRGQATDRNQAI